MNVAPKNPIGRLADTAINTLKNPLETAGKVVEQAKGTAAFGKMVVEQVSRFELDAIEDVFDAPVIVGACTPDDAEDVIAFVEEKLRQVRTVLAGDAGDECRLRVFAHVPPLFRRRWAGKVNAAGRRDDDRLPV